MPPERSTDVRESVGAVDCKTVKVTVSIGVAAMNCAEGQLDALLARADAALYKAKHEGRNKVVRADDPGPDPPA